MESNSTEGKIEQFLMPLLEGTDIFIVSIKVTPTNNLKVYLDADTGLNISKSVSIHRKLYQLIEEAQMFPEGDFALEVGSPGIDEPLVSMRQYQKNIGRTVEVTPLEGVEVLGILKEANDEQVVLGVKVGKKKEITDMTIPLNFIKKIVVQVTF